MEQEARPNEAEAVQHGHEADPEAAVDGLDAGDEAVVAAMPDELAEVQAASHHSLTEPPAE